MSPRKDDELFISRSGGDSLAGPDAAKQKAQEQQAKSEGKFLELKRQVLMQQVGKEGGAAARADEETKRLQKQAEESKKKEKGIGTKTQKQMEEQSTVDAQTTLGTEQILEEEQQQEAAQDQAEQEYQNDDA